jgi:trehalose 6-phosphate synthase
MALGADVRVLLLKGMLGNDLLEFQTERDVESFVACVTEMVPGARAESSTEISLDGGGRRVQVRAFPISIDVERYEWLARTPDSERRVARLRKRYLSKGRELGVCVDRVDYTKGIPERLRALDLLWSTWPELQKRFTFVIVATPSRTAIAAYRALEEEMLAEVARINARYGVRGWTPIVLINENVDASLLAAIYRAADLCVVSSLQDGMNLVAKEFIACQLDERGVLILSRFAGAAERIDGAVLIDPHDAEEFADGIRRGLAMPVTERRERMHRMRAALRNSTIFHWLDDLQRTVTGLRAERVREVPVTTESAKERRTRERRERPVPSEASPN